LDLPVIFIQAIYMYAQLDSLLVFNNVPMVFF